MQKSSRWNVLVVVAIALSLLLVACSANPTAIPAATPRPTPVPTTVPVPSTTSIATATIVPTATAFPIILPPSPSVVVAPSVTPTKIPIGVPTPTNGTSSNLKPNGKFEEGQCPMPKLPEGVEEGKGISCGVLTVPEDHYQPGSKTISLAVAILKGKNSANNPPLIYLAGVPVGAH